MQTFISTCQCSVISHQKVNALFPNALFLYELSGNVIFLHTFFCVWNFFAAALLFAEASDNESGENGNKHKAESCEFSPIHWDRASDGGTDRASNHDKDENASCEWCQP